MAEGAASCSRAEPREGFSVSDYPPRDRAPKRDDDRPARSGSSSGARNDGDKKPWEKRNDAPRSAGDRRPSGGDKKPWEKRDNTSGGGKKPWEKRDGATS